MEENLMLKCIRKSQEYGFLILDSFQHEQIYAFPRTFNSPYKPPYKVTGFEIINYRGIKCGVEPINQFYLLVILLPSIPDHLIKQILYETQQEIQPIFSEISHSQEEYVTPKSTDRSVKHKKVLKPELFEKLSDSLEIFLSLAIYKLYPYFLYEDEDFSCSSISFANLSLPIGIGGIGCYLPLPIPLLYQIEVSCSVLFHDSSVTVHEILSLDSPLGIMEDFLILYKGYVVYGNLLTWQMAEVLKIYNINKLYLRNDSYPEESFIEKVRNNGQDYMIGIVATVGLVVATFNVIISNEANDYDPWMVDKAKRLTSELYELKIISKIEEEFKKNSFSVENEIFEDKKKQELLSIMQKSRSLDSSPIGSPRGSMFKDKTYSPVYIPKHDFFLFHYALINTHTLLVNCPQINASSNFYLNVIRPLFSHYANLYENILKKPQESLVINVKFSDIFDNEKVAVVKLKNCLLFSLFRGNIEKLKQFAYELISLNENT